MKNVDLSILTIGALFWVNVLANFGTKYAGYLYVEQKIRRKESDQLLDELDEGIIILDKAKKEPMYYNKVAKHSSLLKFCQE